MSKEIIQPVVTKSKQTLYGNWASGPSPKEFQETLPTYGFTRPSPANDWYPCQYHWDSLFSTIGWSTFEPKRAKLEMATLYTRQNPDGSIPIVNHWQPLSWRDKLFYNFFAVEGINQLTQPAVGPMALEAIYQATGDKDFVTSYLGKMDQYLNYYVNKRDFDHDRLSSGIHPYEFGTDFSPANVLPMGIRANHPQTLPCFVKFLALAQSYKAMNWNEQKIKACGLYDVEDVLFNVAITESFRSLARLKRVVKLFNGADETDVLAGHIEAAIIKECYDPRSHFFYNLNHVDNGDKKHQKLLVKTIVGLTPLLLENLPADIVAHLVAHLKNTQEFWTQHPVPSIAKDEPSYNPDKSRLIWRGPTWVNTNWFIINGLAKHGCKDLARELAMRTLEMINQFGCAEYYNPETGGPAGVQPFSWSAALALDLCRFLQD